MPDLVRMGSPPGQPQPQPQPQLQLELVTVMLLMAYYAHIRLNIRTTQKR